MNLTRDELLNIVVALDNESYHEHEQGHEEQSEKLLKLKWKVYALMTETNNTVEADNA